MKSCLPVLGLLLCGTVVGFCQPAGGAPAAPGAYASIFADRLSTAVTQAATGPTSYTYYYPHLAAGNSWQTVLTLLNYSPQTVTCQTSFLTDAGLPLKLSFGGAASANRTDVLAAGASLHQITQDAADASTAGGWGMSTCDGPVKPSLLFRLFSGSTAVGEAGVNASTTPASKFVTYAQTSTGVAYANPSTSTALLAIYALDASGHVVGSKSVTLPPNGHGAVNLGPDMGITFTGSVQIISTVPIVSLSINAEAFPSFSSLPAGDLDAATALSNGH